MNESASIDIPQIVILNGVKGLYKPKGVINSLLIYWIETFTLSRRQ